VTQVNDSTLRRFAYALAVLIAAGVALGVTLSIRNGTASSGVEGVPFVLFPIVGLVLATRRPRNPLGWLMLFVGLSFGFPFEDYGRYALVTRGGDLPLGDVALALSGPTWVPFIGLSGFLLLLFPDGHLPSPRWRWFAWFCAGGMTLLVLAFLLTPGTFEDIGFPQVRNPLGIDPLGALVPGVYALVAVVPLTVVGGAVGLVRRLRRATDDVERHQLRWLVWAAGLIAVSYVLAFLPNLLGTPDADDWGTWIQVVGVLSFALIPIAIGIAVLRYRLYDIDLVIRKTVVFTVLAAFITVVYAGVVVGVGALVGSRGDPVLSAIAAALVALAFQPVRRRARRVADRVVYGRRATPYEVLADFSERVGETYAADDVLPRMARVVGEGIGAERAEVWLRLDGHDRLAAVWPSDALPSRSAEAAEAAFAVEHQGQVLGSLAVVTPPKDPMNPEKTKLVTDLAAQAGLVLHNVRLTEELRARLDDLRAAQKRLVSAQDNERKKLERNIHDGAQQQLVALAIKLRLADQLVDRDPVRAHGALAELQTEAATALEDLRDLARGIYPPLLADGGLAAALDSQARRATMPVEVDVRLTARLAPEIEAAVYFSCLECLQNVTKYADASRAVVKVALDGDDVVFEVADDGGGFDPSSHSYGTGLQGIADRIGALDGAVEVWSEPGGGTIVRGRVPASHR
jgi:signal transduction histidine kinase